MSVPTEVQELKEVGELAKRILLEDAKAMYGVVMGTDGETFNDGTMTRSDRILRWVQAAQNGTIDVLRAQSPEVYEKAFKQYQRDIMAELEAVSQSNGA